jgi:hypothetical protein
MGCSDLEVADHLLFTLLHERPPVVSEYGDRDTAAHRRPLLRHMPRWPSHRVSYGNATERAESAWPISRATDDKEGRWPAVHLTKVPCFTDCSPLFRKATALRRRMTASEDDLQARLMGLLSGPISFGTNPFGRAADPVEHRFSPKATKSATGRTLKSRNQSQHSRVLHIKVHPTTSVRGCSPSAVEGIGKQLAPLKSFHTPAS